MYGLTLTPIDFGSVIPDVESIPASLQQLLFAAPTGQSVYYDGSGPIPDYYLKDFSLGQGDERLPRPGACYNLDGTDDYIAVGDLSSAFHSFRCRFHISVAINSSTTQKCLMTYNRAGDTINGIHFGAITGLVTNEVITIANAAGNARTSVTDITIAPGWHELEVVWNSGAGRYDIILDGVTQSVTSGSTTHVTLQSFADVNIARGGSFYFVGKVYDIELKSDEDTVVAHYPCQEEAGTIAYDISGNGHHGTITNTSAGFHTTDTGVLKSYPNDNGYGLNARTLSNSRVNGDVITFKCRIDPSDTLVALMSDLSGGVSNYAGVAQQGSPSSSLNHASAFTVDGVSVTTRSAAYDALCDGDEHDVSLTMSNYAGWPNAGFGQYSGLGALTNGRIWDVKVNGVDANVTYAVVPAISDTEDAVGVLPDYVGPCPYPGLAKGYAWDTDGVSAYVNLASVLNWEVFRANTAWTLEIDVKGWGYIIGNQTDLNSGISSSSGGIRVRVLSTNTTLLNFGITETEWVRIRIQRSGANFTITAKDQSQTYAPSVGATDASAYAVTLGRSGSSYSDVCIGRFSYTLSGLTTTFYPRNGSTAVDVVKSDGTSTQITSAVQGSMTYTLGDGSWRNPAIENGGWSNGTLLVPAAEDGTEAANGEDVNIIPNQAPIGVIVDRRGGIAAPLHAVMGTDAYTSEAFDTYNSENNIDKRLVGTYSSDRYGAALVDISGEDYFDA